jgi:hypothetical protein
MLPARSLLLDRCGVDVPCLELLFLYFCLSVFLSVYYTLVSMRGVLLEQILAGCLVWPL